MNKYLFTDGINGVKELQSLALDIAPEKTQSGKERSAAAAKLDRRSDDEDRKQKAKEKLKV